MHAVYTRSRHARGCLGCLSFSQVVEHRHDHRPFHNTGLALIGTDCAIKRAVPVLASPHKSHSPCLLSLLVYSVLRNTMIFTSLALLSGMVLFSSAAPWYSPPAPVTHCVNVSNDTAGLIFDPPYIVSQPSSHYILTVVLTRPIFQAAVPGDTVSFKFHPKNHTVTQSSFDAPCTPLYGGTDTGLCVLFIQTYITSRVF